MFAIAAMVGLAVFSFFSGGHKTRPKSSGDPVQQILDTKSPFESERERLVKERINRTHQNQLKTQEMLKERLREQEKINAEREAEFERLKADAEGRRAAYGQ